MEKQNIYKSIIFISLFIFLFLPINLVFKSARAKADGGYWKYFFDVLPQDSKDIVFMGNSHAQCSFVPEIIDDILGTESIILITPGSGIYQKEFEFEEVISDQPSTLIVLETAGIYGGRIQENLKPWNYAFFDAMPFSYRKIAVLKDYFTSSNYLNYFFPLLSYRLEWKTPHKFLGRAREAFPFSERKSDLPDNGYYKLFTPISNGYCSQLSENEADLCLVSDLSERLDTLKKMINSSYQKNGKLLLMEVPVLSHSYGNCEDQFDEFIKQNEVRYYSIFDKEKYSNLWFKDEGHTTTFGALFVTLDAIPALAKNSNTEINYAAFDYYSSYLFNDFVIKNEGSTVYVELMPLDEDLSADLLYKWEIKQSDVVVKSVDYQSEKFISFLTNFESEIITSKDYEIHVWINNPEGDFILEGVFNFTD